MRQQSISDAVCLSRRTDRRDDWLTYWPTDQLTDCWPTEYWDASRYRGRYWCGQTADENAAMNLHPWHGRMKAERQCENRQTNNEVNWWTAALHAVRCIIETNRNENDALIEMEIDRYSESERQEKREGEICMQYRGSAICMTLSET